jgi:adenylosuccinate synthase
MVKAIVGANWGDEGKGKITDLLAGNADAVVRYQGGANAGHTIINEYGRFALHLLPSGAFRADTLNVIGPGVALHVPSFLKELSELISRGVPKPNLLISDRTQLVMPYHILFDAYEEERLAGKAFGSTKSGMAPFYSDFAGKTGFQISELYGSEQEFLSKLERILAVKNTLLEHLYGKPTFEPQELLTLLLEWRDNLKPFVGDSTSALKKILSDGKTVLMEGQLGSLRDLVHGIYPYSTSSSPLAGHACVGAGVAPLDFEAILAVTKAYSSCVGAGPFVSELFGDEAERLRKLGGDKGEYGATTGRPRRVGWFDAVATRYGCQIQGATELVLTNLDSLATYAEIPICVAYEYEGKRLENFPNTTILEHCKPILETVPGWLSPIRGVRSWEELPANAQAYVVRLEKLSQTPIHLVSTGPQRDEILTRS